MPETPPTELAIPLPRPVDRRLHLGPFPSARDALKFAGFASGGLLVAPFAGPVAIVPFALAGFLIAVYRSDGRSIDDRILGYATYQWRRRRGPRSGAPRAGRPASGRFARVGAGRLATVLVAGGVPVSFLPPEDARALFETTRRWLDAVGVGAYLVADTVPIAPAPFRPHLAPVGAPDRPASVGYDEVVRLLLRRRRARRVTVVLWEAADPGGADRLESRAAALAEATAALGVSVDRPSGPALSAAIDRLHLRPGALG